MSIHLHVLPHHLLISVSKPPPPFLHLWALASPAPSSFTMLYCVFFFVVLALIFFVSLFLLDFLVFPLPSYLCTALPLSCSAACQLWVPGTPPTLASFPFVLPSFLPPSLSPLGVCLSGDDHRVPKRRLL